MMSLIAIALLAGQTAPAPTATPAPAPVAPAAAAPAAAGKFTLDTPIETIEADAKAKEVLTADLGMDVAQHPAYDSFKSMSLNQVAPITQARTNAMHMGGTGQPDASIDEQKTKKQYETAPVGNAVVLEEQMVKLADAQSSYQLMTNLYRKHVDLFKMALGRGS